MKLIRKKSDTVIIRNECVEKYLYDLKKNKKANAKITQEEEWELLKRAKSGDVKARQELVSIHLKFVVKVAKEYQIKGFDIGDLISAGNIGLIEAIDKFQLNNDVKVKFLSYAVWWIKNHIIEHIKENKGTIRLPFNKQIEIEKYDKAKAKLEQTFEMNLNAEQVFEMTEQNLTEDLRAALLCSYTPASLDVPYQDNEDFDSLSETIPSEPESDTDEEFKSYRRKLLDKSLSTLTETQQKVLRLSFGFDDLIPRSNEDIAETLNLTAERVRQIKDNGLRRLKSERGNKLMNLL